MDLSQFKTVEQLAAAIKTMDMVTSVAWTDYSGTSTIVGWASYTVKQIFYKKIGKLVFVQYYLAGTSDDTVSTFTVPYAGTATMFVYANSLATDNGTNADTAYILLPSTSTVAGYPDKDGGAWTNTGDKKLWGQFWYEVA